MSVEPKDGQLFFDQRGGGFWLCARRRFLALDKSSVNLHLRLSGLSKDKFVGPLNELEKAIVVAQLERCLDYAGPLAGHRRGLLALSDGRSILVTAEPNASVFERSKAKPDCPGLETFFGELFGPVQLPYVLAWLKFSRASLRAGDFRPGHLMVLAGPSNCGKSLFQSLVTEWLGGRSAKPYRYMSGESPFNSDLAESEHLMIEDEHGGSDIRTRRKFGCSLKDMTVNREMSVHGKGKQAIQLPTFRRITLSVNDEPENLMILPPMDGSIADKVLLLHCARASVNPDRLKCWAQLAGELPALAAYLEAWKLPRGMAEPRFGFRSYHAPQLLALLSDISPETRLLNLVDSVLFSERKCEEWDGTALELERQLLNSAFKFAVEKLLYFSSAAGVYLQRLAQQYPERFHFRKNRGKTIWTVKR